MRNKFAKSVLDKRANSKPIEFLKGSDMRRRLKGSSLPVPLALVALLGASASVAETEIDQTLDQVYAFDANAVLEMAFTDPNVTDADVPDFENLGLNGGGGVASCKLAPRGLYCLATAGPTGATYQVVRFWKDPKASPTASSDLLRCDDLPNNASGRCASLTVDLSGGIWLSATNDGRYSLFKVVSPKAFGSAATSCPTGSDSIWTTLPSPAGASLCVAKFASGNGVLSDLSPVDGQEVAGSAVWPFGYGILALRDGSEAVFFDLHAPTDVQNPLHNFGSWGLSVGERLLSTSLLQVPQAGASPPVKNYVLATTNTGSVFARVATDPAPGPGKIPAFDIAGWERDNPGSTSIVLGYNDWATCREKSNCDIRGTTLSASDKTFTTLATAGAVSLGVNGGRVSSEIDVGESITVTFPAKRKVSAIQILALYNRNNVAVDPDETARITVDGRPYTLQAKRIGNLDIAYWSGPGRVSPCGLGCFVISDPFPEAVKVLQFEAVDSPTLSDNSDFSIGQIETVSYAVRTSPTTGRTYVSNRDFQKVLALENGATAPALALDKSTKDGRELALTTGATFSDGITVAPGNRIDVTEECDNPIDTSGQGGCTLVPAADGDAAAKFGNLKLANNSTASGIEVFQVTDVPDCRYLPLVCYDLFEDPKPVLAGTVPEKEKAAKNALISAGWIVPLVPLVPLTAATDPNWDGYKPAVQLLNVTPLLPEDVTSKFDLSGVPPNGLPNLYISNRYRAANEYGHYFGGVFIKAQEGVKFRETFAGEFDVDDLNGGVEGDDLGCKVPTTTRVPVATLLEWDTITRVSETHLSVGGRYIDSLINVGCRNPIKTVVSETSFFPYLEIAPDTYGPTVNSPRVSKVTIANDGVFARLLQSLYDELDETRRAFACAKGDGQSATQQQPLSTAACNNLAKLWSSGEQKLDKCVDAAFQPKSSASNENCQSFRNQFDFYKAALPATPTGADPANRLGEQFGRWEVIKHVFETRFLPSIPANGYCVESGTCK